MNLGVAGQARDQLAGAQTHGDQRVGAQGLDQIDLRAQRSGGIDPQMLRPHPQIDQRGGRPLLGHGQQRAVAERSRGDYQQALAARGYGPITTEILDAPTFYFAEDYHQQYLAKNPAGYCGLGGTGVSCPIGVGVAAA